MYEIYREGQSSKLPVEINYGVATKLIIPEHYREYLELVPTNEVLHILKNESLKDHILPNKDIVRMSNNIYEELGFIVSQSDLFITREDPNAIDWEYRITKECLIGLTISQ